MCSETSLTPCLDFLANESTTVEPSDGSVEEKLSCEPAVKDLFISRLLAFARHDSGGTAGAREDETTVEEDDRLRHRLCSSSTDIETSSCVLPDTTSRLYAVLGLVQRRSLVGNGYEEGRNDKMKRSVFTRSYEALRS